MSAVEFVCVSVSALALAFVLCSRADRRGRTALEAATDEVRAGPGLPGASRVSAALLWFAAGAGAGPYAPQKARRLAYRLTSRGLGDNPAALGLGACVLVGEVRAGTAEREEEIAAAGLGLPGIGTGRAPGPALELIAARGQRAPASLPAPPAPINLR